MSGFLLRKFPAAVSGPVRIGTNWGASVNATTSLTVSYPAGSASGDLIVMLGHFSRGAAGAASINLTGGGVWKTIAIQDDTTAQGVFNGWYWCIRGAETSVTLTATVTTSMRSYDATLVAYQGASVDSTPIGASSSIYALNPGVAAQTVPSVTTTVDLAEILLFSEACTGVSGGSQTTWSTPLTGLTDNTYFNSTVPQSYSQSSAYKQQAAKGATGTFTATASLATAVQRAAAAIAIYPPFVHPPFTASGMNKSGTQAMTAAYAVLAGWTADTAGYPGSTISGNALVANGTKAATVTANVVFTAGAFGSSVNIRIKQNGTVIATGVAKAASPITLTTTASVASNDLLTVEIFDVGSFSNYGTVTAAGTYLRIT